MTTQSAQADDPTRRISTVCLFLVFLRIGMYGFGGLGSVLALVEKEMVEKQQALKADDITEALTYTKLLPGSTVVQVVGYLGWRLGGWAGSAAATIGFVAPAFIVMLALSIFYSQIRTLPDIQGALRGLSAAVVGLLVVTAYRLGRSAIKDYWGLVLAAGALFLAVMVKAPLVAIVVGAGLLGIVGHAIKGGLDE